MLTDKTIIYWRVIPARRKPLATTATKNSVKDDSTNERRTEENNMFGSILCDEEKQKALSGIVQDRRPNLATLPSSGATR